MHHYAWHHFAVYIVVRSKLLIMKDCIFDGLIARDRFGGVWFHPERPHRDGDVWMCDVSDEMKSRPSLYFEENIILPRFVVRNLPSVTWKDEPIHVSFKLSLSEIRVL